MTTDASITLWTIGLACLFVGAWLALWSIRTLTRLLGGRCVKCDHKLIEENLGRCPECGWHKNSSKSTTPLRGLFGGGIVASVLGLGIGTLPWSINMLTNGGERLSTQWLLRIYQYTDIESDFGHRVWDELVNQRTGENWSDKCIRILYEDAVRSAQKEGVGSDAWIDRYGMVISNIRNRYSPDDFEAVRGFSLPPLVEVVGGRESVGQCRMEWLQIQEWWLLDSPVAVRMNNGSRYDGIVWSRIGSIPLRECDQKKQFDLSVGWIDKHGEFGEAITVQVGHVNIAGEPLRRNNITDTDSLEAVTKAIEVGIHSAESVAGHDSWRFWIRMRDTYIGDQRDQDVILRLELVDSHGVIRGAATAILGYSEFGVSARVLSVPFFVSEDADEMNGWEVVMISDPLLSAEYSGVAAFKDRDHEVDRRKVFFE